MQAKFIQAFLVVTLCFASSLTSRADIIGDESRKELPAGPTPFSPVGKIVTERASCTASLVGHKLVLTNAHCVLQGGRDGNGAAAIFYARDNQGGFSHKSRATVLKVGTQRPVLNPDKDWALLELETPLGNELGYFEIKITENNGPVALVSFASDFRASLVPTLEESCEAKFTRLSFVAHRCDTFQGASGAPLLRSLNGKAVIVGMNAAGTSGIWKEPFNFAVEAREFLSAVEFANR